MNKTPSIDNQKELDQVISNFNFIWINDVTKFSIESDANSTSIYLYGRYCPRVSNCPLEDEIIAESPLVGFLFDDVRQLKLPSFGFRMSFGELELNLVRDGIENGGKYEMIDHLRRDFLLRCKRIFFLGKEKVK